MKSPLEPKAKKAPPYPFVLEELARLLPHTKPMFGALGVYVGEQILFILRQKPDRHSADNGVWIATDRAHHESLKAEMPSLKGIEIFGGDTGWRILPESALAFETDVLHACGLVLRRDPRIGKVPQGRRKPGKKGKTKPAGKKAAPAKSPKKRQPRR